MTLQHADETFSVRTFEELANIVSEMGETDSEMPDSRDISAAGEMKASVHETGKTMIVNDVLAEQRILVLEGEFESTSNESTNEGLFFFVTSAWISDVIAGHKTIAETNMEIAKAMGSSFGSTGNSFAGIFAMMQNQDASAKMNKALAELKKMGGGLAVKTDTYMVQAPKGTKLDLEKVLTGEMGTMAQDGFVTSQQTVFAVHNTVGDLKTDKFNLGLLDAPGEYTLIEYANPFEAAGR